MIYNRRVELPSNTSVVIPALEDKLFQTQYRIHHESFSYVCVVLVHSLSDD